MSLITPNTPSCQRGSSMIEVMVALFVLAIGLLGFAGLQTEGITMGRQAYMHSQASILAQDMVERMQANIGATNDYNLAFNAAVSAPVDCAAAVCTAQQLAAWDKTQWLANIAAALPAGFGAVTAVPTGIGTYYAVTIQVQYQLATNRMSRQEQAANQAPPTTYTYTLNTQI